MRAGQAPAHPATGFWRRLLVDILGVTWLVIGIFSGVFLLVFVAILTLAVAACMHVGAASADRKGQ